VIENDGLAFSSGAALDIVFVSEESEQTMPKTTIQLESAQVGAIGFETEYIYSRGGPEFPLLGFTIDVSLTAWLRHTRADQTELLPLSCMHIAGEFSSPEQRVVAAFRDDALIYAADQHVARSSQWRLEIPLDLIAIDRIERERSGNLRAALSFRPTIAIHRQSGEVQEFRQATVQPIVFQIPKSQWVEQILSQTGYGRLELLEFRIADPSKPTGLPRSVEEVRQAQKQLIEGEYDKVVAHCRLAIESILDARDLKLPGTPTFAVRVDTLIHDHLSPRLGEEQAKYLSDQLKRLWGLASKAVHPSAPDYFRRSDAEFLLRNASAVVAYVGSLLLT